MSKQVSVVTTNEGPTPASFRTRGRVGTDVNDQLPAGASRTDMIAAASDNFIKVVGGGKIKMDITNAGTEPVKVKPQPGEPFTIAPGATAPPISKAGELSIGF